MLELDAQIDYESISGSETLVKMFDPDAIMDPYPSVWKNERHKL